MGRGLFATVAVVLCTLVASGCDGSGDSTESGLTKAEFVKRADAICETRLNLLARQYQNLVEDVERNVVKRADARTEFVEAIFLPGLRKEIVELARLSPPEGTQEQVAAIVQAGRVGLRQAESIDSDVLFQQDAYAFEEMNRLARAFGLRACGST